MKNALLSTLLVIIGVISYSCDDSDFEYEDSYKKSLKAWTEFKTKSNDCYAFTVVGGSWAGMSWETTIVVENGEVVQRSFESTRIGGEIGMPSEELKWTENKDELNTHKETSAYPAVTLDVIYDSAKQDWLQKRKGTTTYFETNNNGLISSCGYVADGCQDDCFTGIMIKKIETIKK